MCGIYGLFLNRPLTKDDVQRARSAAQALDHRGPDGFNDWVDRDAGVYLGHHRLAIVDPKPRSDQPMVRGDHVLAYNGELYNFRALREELEAAGSTFETTGDAEVFLEAWRRWGPDALDRFEGMFAALIWDGGAGHVAVDPFGEKPLYWAERSDGLAVASELPPLVDAVDAGSALHGERLTAYLSLGYVPAPATAYEGVHRLPRASQARIEGAELRDPGRYWRPPPPPDPSRNPDHLTEDDLDAIRNALVDSLERRLVSDVPMCLFLSGGVDSSLIAALAKAELDRNLPCITVAFPRGDTTNEAPMAAEVARHLGLEHKVVESTEDPEMAGADQVLDLFGQPNDNITALSVHQMTEIASDLGYKAALTGMGGDEVFYGYQKHAFLADWRILYHLPQTLRVALGSVAERIAWDGKIRYFADLVGLPDHEVYLARKNYPAIDWLRQLLGFDTWARDEFADLRPPFDVTVPRYELEEVMPNSHLPALDHGSMRSPVELRTPFLNKDVVQTVAGFDPRSFMEFGQKEALRRLLRRYLPDELVDRPKQGFTFPMDRFVDLNDRANADLEVVDKRLLEAARRSRGTAPIWTRLLVRILLAQAFNDREVDR